MDQELKDYYQAKYTILSSAIDSCRSELQQDDLRVTKRDYLERKLEELLNELARNEDLSEIE